MEVKKKFPCLYNHWFLMVVEDNESYIMQCAKCGKEVLHKKELP